MTPIPYTAHRENPDERTSFACPRCAADLIREQMAMTCGNCGYAPKHGAD
jgi:ribosomal protein S27AE